MIIWRRLRAHEKVEIGDAWCFRFDPNSLDEPDESVLAFVYKNSFGVGLEAGFYREYPNTHEEGNEVIDLDTHYWRPVTVTSIRRKISSLSKGHTANSSNSVSN